MSNEPLGIYQELRERAQYYEASKVRRRFVSPPRVTNGATAQSVNPFMIYLRNRIRVAGRPNAQRGRGANLRNMRTTWPEAGFGISIDAVIKAVIAESTIRGDEMFSVFQDRRVARPRQVAMYMIDRYCPDYSYPQLGFIFGRDHTTIMAGIEAVTERLLDKDRDTIELVAKVRTHLSSLV